MKNENVGNKLWKFGTCIKIYCPLKHDVGII